MGGDEQHGLDATRITYRLKKKAAEWLLKTAANVNHESVIKDIAQETSLSVQYFVMLTLANLIALSGLITNSVPVIIGAMLISPLMGPLLSFGFAFITGDRTIWRRSIKKISISVGVTLIIAAFAAMLSPLKEITPEILIRTRPNLYDLMIAFLSGIAGSAALCTKRNYLTIVPGVAIATAVIPPLSVAGFGAGIGNFTIISGGFFLFFTNFVAIVIATCIVFFFYGFRPRMVTEMDLQQLRKRFAFLSIVLVVISIPLIYTLHASISEVRLRGTVSELLKKGLNREGSSHLAGFDYRKRAGRIEVNAVVNAVELLSEEDVAGIEAALAKGVGLKTRLSLEQVKVQPGGLKTVVVPASAPAIAPQRPPGEVLRASRESVISIARQSSDKLEKIIAPSSVADLSVGFRDKSFGISVDLKIRRDSPMSGEERLWLKHLLESEMGVPVELSVESVPFVPPLVFRRGDATISDSMRAQLAAIGAVYQKDPQLRCRIDAVAESGLPRRKQRELAGRRIDAVKNILATECGVPKENIATSVNAEARKEPFVHVTVTLSSAVAAAR
jgi:uncharacterized hydrophobic protein (TIGR00271 family)